MASLDEIKRMAFRLSPNTDIGAYKGDLQTFNILMAMDGTRSLEAIAKENFYEISDLADKVRQLVEKGVLIAAQGQTSTQMRTATLDSGVDRAFFNTLQTELTKQLGPVAGLLIKDTVSKMGFGLADFPESKCSELIDELAQFIKNEDKALAFRQSMSSR